MSQAAKRRLSLVGGTVILIGAMLALAFNPPASVPYNAAAYADRAKLGNATGMTSLAAYASPAACAGQVNLFSQNVSYSVPVLSLPGRAGLGMSLRLSYNSKVWVKSGSTIYFDGDKGWPAVGWRLGFGRLDGKYTDASQVDHYYLISSDGSVRDLRYNATSGLFESRDSTYIDFNETTNILRYKDGTQVTFSSTGGFAQPTQIKDRNGNYLTINYTGTAQQISSIVDTVGRTTSFTYNPDGTLNTITKSGFNNAARTWTFGYTNITLTYSFAASLTVNGPASGSSVKVLSSITYPNGTKQAFSYNSYAQLTEAQFQSSSGSVRGKFLVTWNSAPGGGWTDSPTPAAIGNNDGSTTNTWTLAFNTYSTTVTDPNSVPRTTAFLQTGLWDDGLPSQTTIGSPVLRTSLSEWENDGTLANPRVLRVTSTLNDVTPNLQSKVEYSYTSYNNVSEVREYDYGLVLKRRTATTYEAGVNYTSRHILGLPLTAIVYDGAGTAKSRSEYTYDGASLTSATGASNHDDINYGTGLAYRALVTTVTRYTNAAIPSGAVTNTSSYDMLGNLRTESADCCVTKSYNYSASTQFSQPDSIVRGSVTTLTTSSTYDASTSLLATSTDENNKVTSYSYDVADRTTSVTRPDTTVLSTSFDDASATASTTSTTPIEATKSIKQTTESDGLGRATRVIIKDAADTIYSKVDTTYDSLGRRWKVSNPYTGVSASYWTETVYDAISRPTKVIPPDGTQTLNHIAYSYSGDTTTVTDQTGKQRKSKSDALGRQIEVTEPDPDNANSLTLVTSYTYDVRNNVTQISQGSQTRTFVFDDMGRKTSETTPEAGTVSYTYNSDSLLASRTDARGVVTTYSYDSSLNRLSSVSYNVSCCTTTVPATPTVSYTYGTSTALLNNGRLVTMTDGVGQEDFTYDQLARTTQVQKKIYNVNYTTAYTYNLAGKGVNMTYPSGRVVKHEYDAIGRVQNVKNNATQATYAGSATYSTASQLTGFSYGNSVSASYGYSAQRLQLTSLAYAQGVSNLLSLSYGYSQSGNNNGQIATITDNVEGGRSVSDTYDSLHRLKTSVTTGSVGYPQWGLSWTYDRYGNRTAQSVTAGTGPSNSVTVNTSTNRITAMGAATFLYDLNGNLTQDDLYKYKYDAENRMVEIRNLSDVLISTYAFDGHSLRVIKVVGADRTWSIYAGTELISEYDDAASNTYTAGTVPGSAGSDSTATILYQHGDHLTTRLTTENNGDLSNEQAHYPYGEQWYATGTANPSVPRKFTSYMKEDEAATGKLNYAVFREHSARIGRFHMADPVRGRIGNPQRLNRYAYVAGDPMNRADPLGKDPVQMGWPGWGSDELDQCVDPSNPLCGNTAFWGGIFAIVDDVGPGTQAGSNLPFLIDSILGMIGAPLGFGGGQRGIWGPDPGCILVSGPRLVSETRSRFPIRRERGGCTYRMIRNNCEKCVTCTCLWRLVSAWDYDVYEVQQIFELTQKCPPEFLETTKRVGPIRGERRVEVPALAALTVYTNGTRGPFGNCVCDKPTC